MEWTIFPGKDYHHQLNERFYTLFGIELNHRNINKLKGTKLQHKVNSEIIFYCERSELSSAFNGSEFRYI